jgi:uncharacterized protein (TIGR03663 family)
MSKSRTRNKTRNSPFAPQIRTTETSAASVVESDAGMLQPALAPTYPRATASAHAVTLRSLTNVFTLQVAVYVVIALAALFLRLVNLDARPLAPAEAKTALAAWEFLNGKPVGEYASPLLFTLDWLAFFLFGAFDLTARVLPAALSALWVFVPVLARHVLGRTGAVLAALLIAFSPTLLFFSRNLSGADFAVGGALSALILLWKYQESQNTRALYAAAILAGLALTADATAYAVLVGGALYLAYAWVWSRRGGRQTEAAQTSDANRWRSPYARAGALFILTYVLAATTFLLNRDGLGVAFNLLGVWLSAWSGVGAFTTPLNFLLVYEPLALIFGLAGLVLALTLRGQEAEGLGLTRGLAIVTLFAFVWYSLGGDKTPSNLLAVSLPLLLLAGWFVGNLLERARADIEAMGGLRSTLSGEVPIFLMLLLLTAFIYLQTGAFLQQTRFSLALDAFYRLLNANTPEASMTAAFFTLALITLFLLAVFVGLSIVLVGAARTMTLLALVVFAVLALGMLRATALLNFSAAEPLREIIAPTQTPQSMRTLVGDLEWYSEARLGDTHVMRIAADEKLGAVGRWYLRDFPNLQWTNQIENATDAQAVVSPADAPPPGNWMGQRYRVQADWQLGSAGGLDLWKWFLFRQGGGETYQTTMMWLPTEK